MRARGTHRTHKIAVSALIFALMACMWSGSAITAGADTVDQSNVEATEAPAGPKSAVAEKQAEEPAAEFGVTKPMMVTRSRDAASLKTPVIGEDHPKAPGEVMLFKEAKPVDGMLNTWDVTLRVEAKDKQPETADIVLVIDTSGSMNDRGRMDKAKEAAKEFVDKLLPSEATHIGVVSFGSDVHVVQPLTDDQKALNQAIRGLHASGGTFTQGGIKQAREMLAKSAADHKHIVLLSDGKPTFSYEMYTPRSTRVCST
ncbi:Mg-chelatase subunit ChlD [Arcanobacterium haemolyticum]|uniref:vWA domain-containing protein n=1 Tax=Arcanobacterium haemolyticum TaxID=28264 RepID=UPI000D8CEC2F|nr:vWA domain-containing protein [Arcanobacterium haemolyticum]SPT75407.1 Mg-chelatase subunit ChlD [Arcanobacterium haemolyticum]